MKELRFQTHFGLLRDDGATPTVTSGGETITMFLRRIQKDLKDTGHKTILNISDNLLSLASLESLADFCESNPDFKLHAVDLSFNRIFINGEKERQCAQVCFRRIGSSIRYIVLRGNYVSFSAIVETADYEWMVEKVIMDSSEFLQMHLCAYEGESQTRLQNLLKTAQEYEISRFS